MFLYIKVLFLLKEYESLVSKVQTDSHPELKYKSKNDTTFFHEAGQKNLKTICFHFNTANMQNHFLGFGSMVNNICVL